ncbi:MAG: glycerol-3-phosphate dehydrogenase/oxidase, partial [Blastocatellia bacterium]|nr:glycerol-3-phosphate dehydrogenase/oxidase [Blastocatellia bacterium]
GGLRYLEHFDFSLVREGLNERSVLLKIAPHLVEPFPFLIPVYRNNRRNYDHPLKMRAGLALYDLLAGRHRFGKHRQLSQADALKLAPQLDPRGLKGALLYYDALTDDSRLVIDVIKTAHQRGAVISNYIRAAGFIKNEKGRIAGAFLRDELSGAELAARSRIVINATGVWMNDVVGLDPQQEPDFSKQVRPSKGIHLTIPAGKLQVGSAWLIPSVSGKRFYFVVPWHGRVNIGTTDTDYVGDKDSPRAESEEISEILAAINVYFPAARLEPSDVISSWAGLRPLISDQHLTKTADVSRKEEIYEAPDGLISIAGGKLTTYRLMAKRTIDLAARQLREKYAIVARDSATHEAPISGGLLTREELRERASGLNGDLSRLVFTYGSNYSRILELVSEEEGLREPLAAGLPQIKAEVVYAVREEMAVTLADLLVRRTRLAILAGEDSLKCAAAAADLMAREFGWSADEVEKQIAQFHAELDREYIVS